MIVPQERGLFNRRMAAETEKEDTAVEQAVDLCELDQSLGDHAPFLVALSDGLGETLRLVLAPATAGEPGGAVPELGDLDVAACGALSIRRLRPPAPGKTLELWDSLC